jgi:GH18 family chitinase
MLSSTFLLLMTSTITAGTDTSPLATFAVTSSWDGGFNGSLTIENRSTTTIDGWTLVYDGGPDITSLWNANWSVDGQTTTLSNLDWNAVIAPGASVTMGFGANGTLQENVEACTLNGEACEVAYAGADDGGDGGDGDTNTGPFHCAGDVDLNGVVGVDDLLILLANWGDAGTGDADGSGAVDVDDLLLVLNGWGNCPEAKRIVAYFIEWGIYGRNFQPTDMDLGRITHINYAFANIGDDLRIAMGDPYAAIDKSYPGDTWDQPWRGCYNQINNVLRAQYPHIKTLISVGGWTWSGRFSDVALTEASRGVFAQSCVEFIRAYNFDGVDIDWEYPVCCGLGGNTYRPEDNANYTLLLAELRSQLDAAAAEDGRTYLLTIAAPAGYDKIANIDPAGIAASCDWINVMTYDFHGAWDLSMTGHHAALYANPDDPSDPAVAQLYNAAAAIDLFIDAGVPSDELVLGVPFYGRAWAGVGPTNNGLFQSATHVPPGTWDDWSSGATGVNDFTEIETFLASGDYTLYRDERSKVPWLYAPDVLGGHFISFDDAVSMGVKTQFVQDRSLGGIMFWEVTGDRAWHLLDVIVEGLGGSLPSP